MELAGVHNQRYEVIHWWRILPHGIPLNGLPLDFNTQTFVVDLTKTFTTANIVFTALEKPETFSICAEPHERVFRADSHALYMGRLAI